MEPKAFSLLKTRRDFIRQAACAALGTVALNTAIRDLRFINAAMAQTPVTDYKALVCVFLYGGNDSNNLLVPRAGDDYTNYAAIRQNLALPASSLSCSSRSAGLRRPRPHSGPRPLANR